MKLGAREVTAFLNAPQNHAGVLVYGPDRGLVQERAHHVLKAILPDPSDPFAKAELRADQLADDPSLLSDELAALSFGGGRRLVYLRDAGDKHSAAVEAAMAYLDKQNFLLVTGDDLGPRSALRRLFEAHGSSAALPCYKDEGASLRQLIEAQLREFCLSYTPETLTFLLYHLGGDRQMIRSELEKIALYCGDDKRIDNAILSQLIGENLTQSFDKLSAAVAMGDAENTARLLDRLVAEGESEVAIIRILARHFSRLLEIQEKVAQGQSVEQAVSSLRPPVFFKEQQVIAHQARRWRPKLLENVLQLLWEAERDSKLGGDLSAVIASHYLLRICRAAA